MSYLDRIQACQVFDPADYVPFVVAEANVGLVRRDFLAKLTGYEAVLQVSDQSIRLNERLNTYEDRTQALGDVLRDLVGKGVIPGWRDEAYVVSAGYGQEPLMEIERAAVPLFGIEGRGVHVNGITTVAGALHMWIGKRSLDKPTAPGKLDQLVAGGQPAHLTLGENLIKECAEEADIPPALAETACPVGALTYCTEQPDGLRRDVLFVYDLDVPADFTPRNTDGELEAFHLWPIDHVAERVRESDDFKFNCALIVIDFLIRKGFIPPDDPEYVELIRGMHQ